ncbi:MAG TPA: holo-ACP synthase [Fulvivirga sp.]|nr:holo-ACP synthase [Fulvivirga sp.]
MIKGIGTDIVENSRIEKSLSRGDEFKKLVFHGDEIAYCEGRGKSLESYAGRFAAKEAFLKAIGTGWRDKLALNEILFANDGLGKPFLKLQGKTKDSLKEYLNCNIHVSISHTAHYATSVVIIEDNNA